MLVILENLGILLGRQLSATREQSKLREILIGDSPFTLLTTSTSYVDEASRHDAPFYDFFQIVTLEDLSRIDVAQLVEARAEWDGDTQLLGQMEQVRQRIDAIFHFSGGNPRLVLALYGILRRGVTEDLNKQLLKLLDEVTPYYQARLGDVSPQMVRVLTAMTLSDGPTTPAEVARRTRLTTTQITANISKLTQERFVRPGGRPDGRRRYYEVVDRLFRLWLQMREGGEGRRKLRFLTEFFQRWYGGKNAELWRDATHVADVFWQEIRSGRPARCADLLATLEYLGSAFPGEYRDLIIESLAEGLEAAGPDDLAPMVPLLEKLASEIEDATRKSAVNLMLTRAYRTLGRLEPARQAFGRVVLDESTLGADGLNLYLDALAYVAGAPEAFKKGLVWLKKMRMMKYCQLQLGELGAEVGEVGRAKELFEAHLAQTDCVNCRRLAYKRIFFALMRSRAYDAAMEFMGQAVRDGKAEIEIRAMEATARWWAEKLKDAEELARLAEEWGDPDDVPPWYVYQLVCVRTHGDRPDDALRLMRGVQVRYGNGFWDQFSGHVIECLVRIAVNHDIPSDVLEWLVGDRSNREFLASACRAEMPRLASSAGRYRRGILDAYRVLVARDVLPGDIEPYAAAVSVVSSEDREKSLAALHPEMREAVSFLIGTERSQRKVEAEHGSVSNPTLN